MTTQLYSHLETIARELLEHRYRAADIPRADGVGVYALFLTDPSALPSIAVGKSGVLYVGMTESSLTARNHFTHQHSGFSTLRRSLGALLKDELHLLAIPRAPGPSKTNVRNFRFSRENEERLTRWIENYIAYGFASVDHDIRAVERALIAELKPPLNLTALAGWRNPHAAKVRHARRECRSQAQQVQTDQQACL